MVAKRYCEESPDLSGDDEAISCFKVGKGTGDCRVRLMADSQ